ncbi:MAG: hypothetical protein ACI4TE_06890 [Alphaproteobacteria bacterium]
MMITRTALSGIQSAQVRFEKSADKIVNAFSVPEQQEQSGIAPINGVQSVGIRSTAFTASEDVFMEETVNMMTASFAYKTNIDVFKTWNETTENVLTELTA